MPARRRRRRLRRSAALLVLPLAAGCAREPAPEPPPAAAHAVHAASLRRTMEDLRQLSAGRLPQTLDPQASREARLREFRAALEAIASTATRIPEAAGPAVDPADRETFVALAASLRDDARGLAARAPELSDRERRVRFQSLMETCQDCHRRFRIPLDDDGR